MAFKNKKQFKNGGKPSRKQIRKEHRKQKKVRKNEYYTNRKKPGHITSNTEKLIETSNQKETAKNFSKNDEDVSSSISHNQVLSTEEQRKKEKREQKKIMNEMNKQRNKQLLDANIEEDRTIKRLEKQLKLNKRKTKAVPKSFSSDGLDYLLEVCDSEAMKGAIATETELNEVNDQFEEDFALMTDTNPNKKVSSNKKKKVAYPDSGDEESEGDFEHLLNEDDISDEEGFTDEEEEVSNLEDNFSSDESDQENESDEESDDPKEKSVNKTGGSKSTNKRKHVDESKSAKKQKTNNDDQDNSGDSDINNDEDSDEDMGEEDVSDEDKDLEEQDVTKKNADGTWEDIYGRLRSKDGEIISKTQGKYIPPAIRAKMENHSSEDKKRAEKLERLKKQLKGLINRLAESNMHSIAGQIEELYMNNSRNDMNDTITSLMMDSLVSNVIAPERLLMEHVLLISILHANVGTEVGAHFLQTTVKKFVEYLDANHEVENKMLDNVVAIIAQMYNFKLFDCKLVYEILKKLSEKFEEKDVECILLILRSVGFSLRKDDPLKLKELILELQKKATSVSEDNKDNSRVKFMLDILLAIKNNNVTKIPNYDTSYSEHLKKIMKGFIRKGNYITQLNISLEDLIKAEERGRWWVVGSAWTGNAPEDNEKKSKTSQTSAFSQKLLELARQQRMNTDTRRNIFCIIMSAEDYLDAFEKLLHLGLKNQQEREIIHVLLHCCLREKVFNPYYAVLAEKFCEYDRKFQMTIKCSVWDKLKSLNDHSGLQISNLAKLLSHLFIEKALPISTLKIVQFSELDKITLRFIRQILLGILLHKDVEACQGVFENVVRSEKLKMFRESLRLFIHHFLLKNLKTDNISEDKRNLLESRAKIVEKILNAKEERILF